MQRKNSKNLISIAIYQLMHTYPYNKINVKLICEKAGVSRMSFYRYYSKKEDIFINFSDERFAEFYELYMQDKEITMSSFIRNIFFYFKKFSRQIRMLEKAGMMDILIEPFERYTAYLLQNDKSKALEEFHSNPHFVPYFAGGLFNVLLYWCKGDFKMTEDEMTKHFERIFLINK